MEAEALPLNGRLLIVNPSVPVFPNLLFLTCVLLSKAKGKAKEAEARAEAEAEAEAEREADASQLPLAQTDKALPQIPSSASPWRCPRSSLPIERWIHAMDEVVISPLGVAPSPP
jgi:hypothetical protein